MLNFTMGKTSRLVACVTLLSLLGCSQPAPPKSSDPFVGTWIGRWDGQWTVMFIVKQNGSKYDVAYRWEESFGAAFSKQELQGTATGSSLSMGHIAIEFDPSDRQRARAHGRFKNPKTAFLFHIDETNEDVLTVAHVEQQLDIMEAH